RLDGFLRLDPDIRPLVGIVLRPDDRPEAVLVLPVLVDLEPVAPQDLTELLAALRVAVQIDLPAQTRIDMCHCRPSGSDGSIRTRSDRESYCKWSAQGRSASRIGGEDAAQRARRRRTGPGGRVPRIRHSRAGGNPASAQLG